MSDEENGHASSRLDRLEEFSEILMREHIAFAEEHKKLLIAQVVLNDQLQATAEAQKHTDERMNALIAVVDDLVRRRPQ